MKIFRNMDAAPSELLLLTVKKGVLFGAICGFMLGLVAAIFIRAIKSNDTEFDLLLMLSVSLPIIMILIFGDLQIRKLIIPAIRKRLNK